MTPIPIHHARIYHTSGSGSSTQIAWWCLDFLRSRGLDVQMQEMGNFPAPAPAPQDSCPADARCLEVYVFPVLGFSAPRHVYRYLRHQRPHNPGQGLTPQPAWVLACNGGGPWGAGERLAGFLGRRRSGTKEVSVCSPILPAQWTQVGELPELHQAKVAMARVKPALELWLHSAWTRLQDPDAPPPPSWLPGEAESSHNPPAWLACILGALIAGLFRSLVSRLLGTLYTADTSCNGCGLCARRCPCATIRMPPVAGGPQRPGWGLSCSACNRCINICPKKSIQCTWARLVVLAGCHLPGLAALIVLPVILGWPGLAWGLLAAVGAFGLHLAGLGLLGRLESGAKASSWVLASWTAGFGRYHWSLEKPGSPLPGPVD